MGKFTLDSKVKEILADPEARAIVEGYIPGASQHPQLFIVNRMKVGKLLDKGHVVGLTQAQVNEMKRRLEEV